MKIIHLMDGESVSSGANQGDTFHINMAKEARGIVQYQVTASGSFSGTFTLEGRLSDAFAWKTIYGSSKSLSTSGGGGTTGAAAEDLSLFPEIRGAVQVTSGTSTVEIRLGA